ncbi:hypothetical protein, partial [Curtobacterium citreum]|uniref:hypothetical protein n=1 Tax=Curtobacterium citreum TaxID=2036 RepID=UPI0019D47DEA
MPGFANARATVADHDPSESCDATDRNCAVPPVAVGRSCSSSRSTGAPDAVNIRSVAARSPAVGSRSVTRCWVMVATEPAAFV